jgi:hypothetical protein
MMNHYILIYFHLFFFREFESNSVAVNAEDETEELSAADVNF